MTYTSSSISLRGGDDYVPSFRSLHYLADAASKFLFDASVPALVNQARSSDSMTFFLFSRSDSYFDVEILLFALRVFGMGYCCLFSFNDSYSAFSIFNYIKCNLEEKISIVQSLSVLADELLEEEFLLGWRIIVSGRYGEQDRATRLTVTHGSLKLGSVISKIDYYSNFLVLRHGKCGLKIWLSMSKDISDSTLYLRNNYDEKV